MNEEIEFLLSKYPLRADEQVTRAGLSRTADGLTGWALVEKVQRKPESPTQPGMFASNRDS